MRRTLVLAIAGLLTVGAAGVALAQSAPAGNATTVVPAAESASPSASDAPVLKHSDTVLSDVLDELVDKGTIDESQKTAILDALTAKRTALIEERQALREQLQELWADGQITEDELAQLPEDSALRQLPDLLDDGKITLDELRGLGRGFGFGFGGRAGGHGGMFGDGFRGPGGMWGAPDGTAPEASPTTSS